MSGLLIAAVALGGALGALGRWGIHAWLEGRPDALLHGSGFPWSTLIVNASGALFLGVVMRLVVAAPGTGLLRAFAAAGLAGGFTTFSTYSYEGMMLLQARMYGRAALYMGGSVVAGLAAVSLGFLLGGMFRN